MKFNSPLPFLLDITLEEEALFETLDIENVYLEMANFEIDIAE